MSDQNSDTTSVDATVSGESPDVGSSTPGVGSPSSGISQPRASDSANTPLPVDGGDRTTTTSWGTDASDQGTAFTISVPGPLGKLIWYIAFGAFLAFVGFVLFKIGGVFFNR
jgi:hypothetical protein